MGIALVRVGRNFQVCQHYKLVKETGELIPYSKDDGFWPSQTTKAKGSPKFIDLVDSQTNFRKIIVGRGDLYTVAKKSYYYFRKNNKKV